MHRVQGNEHVALPEGNVDNYKVVNVIKVFTNTLRGNVGMDTTDDKVS